MRTGAATVEELIAHGGWLIDDARARQRENPDTFLMPQPETLMAVAPGAQVRAIFMVADQADPVIDGVAPYGPDGHPNLVVGHERMWLWVEEVVGDGPAAEVVGLLANSPVATHTRLRPGARVRLPLQQVIDVAVQPPVDMADEIDAMTELGFPPLSEADTSAPEDPQRPPTIDPAMAAVAESNGVPPQRPYPAPMVRMLIGKTVEPGARPVFGGRGRPNPDRGDSGWTVWATRPDLQEASEIDGFEILPTTELRGRCPDAWAFLALPPGWAFVLGPDGSVDVYEEPELLR